MPKRDGSNEAFEARVRAELARKPAFSLRDLAVGRRRRRSQCWYGAERRLPEYPGDARVGAALRYLFEQVTDEPERNERTLLLRILEQYLNSPGAA